MAIKNISVFVRQKENLCSFTTSDSWVILSEIEQQIKEKIERIGTPLKDWEIQINYGIKTGFNEAFIIDAAKRNELIALDPKSEEIIRPILRGRDIKRYGYDFAERYLIATFPSRNYNIDDYPALKTFLEGFKPKLRQTGERLTQSEIEQVIAHAKANGIRLKENDLKNSRKKTNNKWFETQDSISYWEDFSKQKMTYIEIMTDNPEDGYEFPCFSFDTENCVALNTAYIMTGNVDELKYILGILNSKLGRVLVKNYVVQLQQRQFRMLNQYVINFPIPKNKDVKPISTLVDKTINNKKQLKDIKSLEKKIDESVYQLFDFNAEEIEFISSL